MGFLGYVTRNFVILHGQFEYLPAAAKLTRNFSASRISGSRSTLSKSFSTAPKYVFSCCQKLCGFCKIKNLHQSRDHKVHGPLTRCTKLQVAHAPGMPITFSPSPRVSDPDMHRGTCVTHVPWCIPGSLTNRFLWSWWRENVPGIPRACTTTTECGLRKPRGMGITKPMSPAPLFSEFFSIVKTHVSCWISRLYLTCVAAARMRWHIF